MDDDGIIRAMLQSGYTAMAWYNDILDTKKDGEEWQDAYGFRFRRNDTHVELLAGGQWVYYPWWMG